MALDSLNEYIQCPNCSNRTYDWYNCISCWFILLDTFEEKNWIEELTFSIKSAIDWLIGEEEWKITFQIPNLNEITIKYRLKLGQKNWSEADGIIPIKQIELFFPSKTPNDVRERVRKYKSEIESAVRRAFYWD